MFYLSLIEHTLRLPPHLLDLPLNEAIKGELESLFLDKVIANLGLCISVYDIRSIDGGFVFPGDGASTYTVEFRLVMFRPFVGEIITAKLKESDANGLRLSLGFFDDIYIPVHLMPNPCHCEPNPEKKGQVIWIWDYQEQKFPIDGIDEIRFQVQSVSYPPIPVEQPKESKPFAPMVIMVSSSFELLIFKVFHL
ncbi:uncharacterized protein LOC100261445 isoform X1 [Vitis vinifera]|uniref:uncharacterized protein LOC100261445 isoform X1 n=1 Tax=Vitis vinifera TaxID=29760 RepID=UPI002882E6FD|nr:uncharacterized protein LOC100261445 isoform X1 [Vitis vinifera]